MEFILAVSLVVVIVLSFLIIAVSELLLKQKDEEIAWYKYLAERNRDIIKKIFENSEKNS